MKNPLRPTVVVGNSELTEPVAPEVQRALERASIASFDHVKEALEPFGLHPYNIVAPEFRQVVYRDEMPIFAALALADNQIRSERESFEHERLLDAQ